MLENDLLKKFDVVDSSQLISINSQGSFTYDVRQHWGMTKGCENFEKV